MCGGKCAARIGTAFPLSVFTGIGTPAITLVCSPDVTAQEPADHDGGGAASGPRYFCRTAAPIAAFTAFLGAGLV